jgi:hypothetical protein
MCRMIFARGRFDVAAITAAAVAMSCGETAEHDNATTVHRHGWGAIWRDIDTGRLRTHRDVRPAVETIDDSPLRDVDTDLLAIHVRNATLPHTRGIRFTHPLRRAGEDWHFMHNGYLPTVHRLLGKADAGFDTAEYFDYLVPPGTTRLDPDHTLRRLRAIPAGGGSSGNAIVVHPSAAYVIHWSPPECRTPVFFQLHRHRGTDVEIVASEIVPRLAPDWQPLPPSTVVTYPLTPPDVTIGALVTEGVAA